MGFEKAASLSQISVKNGAVAILSLKILILSKKLKRFS